MSEHDEFLQKVQEDTKTFLAEYHATIARLSARVDALTGVILVFAEQLGYDEKVLPEALKILEKTQTEKRLEKLEDRSSEIAARASALLEPVKRKPGELPSHAPESEEEPPEQNP